MHLFPTHFLEIAVHFKHLNSFKIDNDNQDLLEIKITCKYMSPFPWVQLHKFTNCLLIRRFLILVFFFFSTVAEEYKSAGNKAFGKHDFVKAIYLYTEGITVNSKDDELNAKLYNNRATAHFYSGKEL